MTFIYILCVAFMVDLYFGELDYPFHPIRLMGHYIYKFQKIFRRQNQSAIQEKRLGLLLILSLLCVTGGIVVAMTVMTDGVLGVLVDFYLMYSVMSIGCLKNESMKVYDALKTKDIVLAREMVGRIVGRDTDQLTEEEIIKATVETVAENTSDGGIAPIFYLLLGGPVLAFIYKGINTMDSMVGYKNDKYIHFGRYPALLDDIANFIPARLTALFMILASALLNLDSRQGFKMMKRDASQHKSPNAGYPEGVIAGALGIQLGGDGRYFGKTVKKATIGDPTRLVQVEDIKKANHVLYFAGVMFVLFGIGVRMVLL